MMKKSIYFVLRGCVMAGLASAFAANATQTVQPVKDVAGTAYGGSGTAWTGTAGLGTIVTVIGRYTTDTAGGNESGLGIKVVYDEAKFTGVSVTALNTKCMIAPPQIQPGGAATKAVMGFIDTSVRSTAGAVGWPYLADPAAASPTSPCLSPNTPANDTSATASGPVNLFQFQGTLAAGVGVGGTATVRFVSDGNFSYAGATPGMADQLLTITAAPALGCNLDADGNGGALDGFSDGLLVFRYLLGVGNTSLQNGVTGNLPRNTAVLVRAYLDTQNLAVVSPTGPADGFVDGILIFRLMLGVGDASLLRGVTLPAGAPTTAAAVRAQVNARCGTSF